MAGPSYYAVQRHSYPRAGAGAGAGAAVADRAGCGGSAVAKPRQAEACVVEDCEDGEEPCVHRDFVPVSMSWTLFGSHGFVSSF